MNHISIPLRKERRLWFYTVLVLFLGNLMTPVYGSPHDFGETDDDRADTLFEWVGDFDDASRILSQNGINVSNGRAELNLTPQARLDYPPYPAVMFVYHVSSSGNDWFSATYAADNRSGYEKWEVKGIRPAYVIMGNEFYKELEERETRGSLAMAVISDNIDTSASLFGFPIVLDFDYPDRKPTVVPMCSTRTLHILKKKKGAKK